MRIAQASEASRLSNPALTAAAASAKYESRSFPTLFASRDQSNSVNSSTRNRDNQSPSRSSNTRNKQHAISNSSKQFAQSSSRNNSSAPDRSTPSRPSAVLEPNSGNGYLAIVLVESLELETSLELDSLFQVWQNRPHLVDMYNRRKNAMPTLCV